MLTLYYDKSFVFSAICCLFVQQFTAFKISVTNQETKRPR